MRVSTPIAVTLPEKGVLFAESAHAVNFQMSERTDPCHKLILVLEGSVAYRETGGQTVKVEAGSVIAVPAGIEHSLKDERTATLFLLCLEKGFLQFDPELEGLWQAVARSPRRSIRLGRPARHRAEGIWRRALAEKAHRRAGARAATRALAIETLVLLARLPAGGRTGAPGERVAAVMHEVAETFFEPWDIDLAAGRAGLSRRRFTGLFREASGMTFVEFLTERRLEHAARLLRSGEHTVTGVIFSCGFSDVSHFYRLFRERFGVAPGEWMRPLRLREPGIPR